GDPPATARPRPVRAPTGRPRPRHHRRPGARGRPRAPAQRGRAPGRGQHDPAGNGRRPRPHAARTAGGRARPRRLRRRRGPRAEDPAHRGQGPGPTHPTPDAKRGGVRPDPGGRRLRRDRGGRRCRRPPLLWGSQPCGRGPWSTPV
ncbi:MAG: hypothetical protein AVDCRST_MAG73-3737, partial [uncultured Thermomicrobiales bacterium]